MCFCDVVPFSQVVAFLCADEEAGAAAVEAAPDQALYTIKGLVGGCERIERIMRGGRSERNARYR
jgi:hypothetical protein